jgi:heme exporter protein D
MPELGKYAGAVLGSWAVTLGLIAALLLLTWMQSRKAKAALDEIEARRAGDGGR